MAEPVVNFSDLSTDKKQQFLSFLVNNNIKFQEGTDNYIAKVTLRDTKKGKDKENRQPHSPVRKMAVASSRHQQQQTPTASIKKVASGTPTNNHSQSSHHKPLQMLRSLNNNMGSESKPAEKAASPAKSKQKQAQKGHGRQLTITAYQTPPSQRSSLPPPEPQQPQVAQPRRNRSKSAHSRPKEIVTAESQVKPAREAESKHKVKGNTSLQLIKAANPSQEGQTLSHPSRQVSMSHSVQSHQPLLQIQQQQSQQKSQQPPYPPEHLTELLSILRVHQTGSRPTRLPRAQVLKLIEQLYSSNFARNNQLLKHRKLKEAYSRGSGIFSSYVIEHFEERYRTQKLCHGHLLNFAHSLLCYLNEQEPPSSLEMFYRFLLEDYEYPELVFFLFIRSVFEKEFGETMEKVVAAPNRIYQEHSLSRREVSRFIRAIFGRDSQEIVNDYQQLVFIQMRDSIPLYELFTLMLLDYQGKRKVKEQQNCQLSHVDTNATVSPTNRQLDDQESYRGGPRFRVLVPAQQLPQQSPAPVPPAHTKSSKCSLFHEGNSSNFEQLTFGEYSTSNRVEEEDETEFWNDFESLKAPEDDALFKELEHKLKKKVSELVQIMLGDEESLWTGPAKQLGRLILNKSLRMLQAIFAMDKIKWFRLVRVHRPQPQHLETVEALQLMLRNIRRLRKGTEESEELRQLESQFCKGLLTVEQLKRAIERIVIG